MAHYVGQKVIYFKRVGNQIVQKEAKVVRIHTYTDRNPLIIIKHDGWPYPITVSPKSLQEAASQL